MPKTRIPSSLKLAAIGTFAFAAQFGCSDDPQPGTTFPPNNNTSGTGNNTAGTPGSGGTPFGTAGTSAGVSGSSPFGTAGTPATAGAGGAGTAGAATGGTGGAGTAGATTGGTGGTGIVPQDPYCMGKTPDALPFQVTSAFYPSGWYPDGKQIELPGEGTSPALAIDACSAGERAAGAVGACTAWRYKPNTPATWAAVGYVTSDGAGGMHAPVCLPTDATALTFLARGVKGGEKLSIGGLAVDPEVIIELTTEWKRFAIPVTGVNYNSFESGVKSGFSWKVDPVENQPVVEFWVDDIQVVKGDLPPDPSGSGGDGSGGANQ